MNRRRTFKDDVALYKQVLQAPTSEERISLMKQVLQTAADNFWVIGISSASDSYRPLSARLANVPATGSTAGIRAASHCLPGAVVLQELSSCVTISCRVRFIWDGM